MKKKKLYTGIASVAFLSVCALLVCVGLFNAAPSKDDNSANNAQENYAAISSDANDSNAENPANANNQQNNGPLKIYNFIRNNANVATDVKSDQASNEQTPNKEAAKEPAAEESKDVEVLNHGNYHGEVSISSIYNDAAVRDKSQNAEPIYWKISDDGVLLLNNQNDADGTYKEFMTTGDVPPWSDSMKTVKKVKIENEIAPTNISYFFTPVKGYGYHPASAVENIEGVSNLNMANVENADFAFSGTKNLKDLDIASLNLEKVTSAICMFDYSELPNEFLLNTAKTISANMVATPYMFDNCLQLAGDFVCPDLSTVQDATGMFGHTANLTSFKFTKNENQTESSFQDFLYASGVTNVNVKEWNPAANSNIKYMFYKCDKLSKIECAADMDWSKIEGVNGEKMFFGCTSLPNYDATKVGLEMAKAGAYFEPDVDYFAVTIDDETASGYAYIDIQHRSGLNLSYKINDEKEWHELTGTTWRIKELNNGDKVIFKGNNPDGFTLPTTSSCQIKPSNKFNISGQLTSLIYDDETNSEKTSVIPSENCFYGLFKGSTNLVSISSNLLPFTTLKDYCYSNMFSGCSNLVNISAGFTLPAKTLQSYCYSSMFNGCSGLTELPEGFTLPAETLALNCYDGMFEGCYGLTELSDNFVLPAETLASYCYQNMFSGCYGLTELPEGFTLPAETLASNCYQNMFSGCYGLTELPDNFALPAETLASYCYYRMFEGCSGLTELPDNFALPAETLASYCYYTMFNGCSGLTKLPNNFKLPAETLDTYCYNGMFKGCSGLTKLPDGFTLPATELASSCYKGMFNGCSGLTKLPDGFTLPAETLQPSCYDIMFSGCSGLTKLPDGFKLPATELDISCYKGMFNGCSSLTELPDGFILLAKELKSSCYCEMFHNCSNLVINKVSGKQLIVTIPSAGYNTAFVRDMFTGTKGSATEDKYPEKGVSYYFGDDVTQHDLTFYKGANIQDITDADDKSISQVKCDDGVDYSFKVVPDDGCTVSSVTVARAEGDPEELSPVDGIYTIENVTTDCTINTAAEKPQPTEYTVTMDLQGGSVDNVPEGWKEVKSSNDGESNELRTIYFHVPDATTWKEPFSVRNESPDGEKYLEYEKAELEGYYKIKEQVDIDAWDAIWIEEQDGTHASGGNYRDIQTNNCLNLVNWSMGEWTLYDPTPGVIQYYKNYSEGTSMEEVVAEWDGIKFTKDGYEYDGIDTHGIITITAPTEISVIWKEPAGHTISFDTLGCEVPGGNITGIPDGAVFTTNGTTASVIYMGQTIATRYADAGGAEGYFTWEPNQIDSIVSDNTVSVEFHEGPLPGNRVLLQDTTEAGLQVKYFPVFNGTCEENGFKFFDAETGGDELHSEATMNEVREFVCGHEQTWVEITEGGGIAGTGKCICIRDWENGGKISHSWNEIKGSDAEATSSQIKNYNLGDVFAEDHWCGLDWLPSKAGSDPAPYIKDADGVSTEVSANNFYSLGWLGSTVKIQSCKGYLLFGALIGSYTWNNNTWSTTSASFTDPMLLFSRAFSVE